MNWAELIPNPVTAADIVSWIGLITTVIIYQQKKRSSMLWWKLISDAVWMISYFLMGAYSGVATIVVAIFRSIVFLNADKNRKWAQSKLWPLIFCLSTIAFSLMTWQGPMTLLTLFGSLMCIIAYWIGNPKLVRFTSFPAGTLYLIYMYHFRSIGGMLNEIFIIVSSLIGIIRLDILKKAPAGVKVKGASAEAASQTEKGE